MHYPFSSRTCSLALAFILMIAGGAQMAQASSLAGFKGKYGGVLLVTQGTLNLPANADTKVKASRKSAKFTVKGTLNGSAYVYTLSLANGRATASKLFPGATGSVFAKSATGTYKVHGKKVTITFTNPAGFVGSAHITIGYTNANSTLAISGILSLQGVETIYSTILGG